MSDQSTALVAAPASEVKLGKPIEQMDHALKMSVAMAKGELVPKAFRNKPADVFIALAWGAELGLAPIQAINSLAVINGRPSIYGDGMMGIVLRSGLLEEMEEADNATDDKPATWATCMVKRKDSIKLTRKFTMAQAITAGLIAKSKDTGRGPGPWITYPTRMLQMRARGYALRDGFADVLRGLTLTVEEARDIVPHADDIVVEVTPAAAHGVHRKSEAAPADLDERGADRETATPADLTEAALDAEAVTVVTEAGAAPETEAAPSEPRGQADSQAPAQPEASPPPAEEQQPAANADGEALITDEQRMEFLTVAEKNGKDRYLRYMFMRRELNMAESCESNDITVDDFPKAIAWAKTPAAASQPPAPGELYG